MESRKALKIRAKKNLKQYFWPSVLVCAVASVLGADMGMGLNSSSGWSVKTGAGQLEQQLQGVDAQTLIAVFLAAGAILLGVTAIGILWQCLVGNVVQPGLCLYFMESRKLGKSAGIGSLFSAFTQGSYGNTVKTMFMKNLSILLWSLLFLIPGIIKAYQYALVPYILADAPQLEWREALRKSKEMMNGNKWRLFVLQLSFIGWQILGTLLCGIGLLFVIPYFNAAITEFYVFLRSRQPE